MPLFGGLFKKYKYVLKARAPSGVWEDIEEYDKPVSYAEVSDTIEDLRDRGYTYVRLEKRDGDRLVKLLWSKRFATAQAVRNPSKMTLEDFATLMKQVRELKEVLGIKEMSPEDALANALYWRNVWRELVEEAKKEVGGGKSDLREVLDILSSLRGFQLPQQPLPQPQPQTQAPKPQSVWVMENLPEDVEREVNELLGRAESKTVEEAKDLLSPPCVKEGTCREGEEE